MAEKNKGGGKPADERPVASTEAEGVLQEQLAKLQQAHAQLETEHAELQTAFELLKTDRDELESEFDKLSEAKDQLEQQLAEALEGAGGDEPAALRQEFQVERQRPKVVSVVLRHKSQVGDEELDAGAEIAQIALHPAASHNYVIDGCRNGRCAVVEHG